MRALEPTDRGHLDARGFRIGYEVFGGPTGRPILFIPTWQLVHMRIWKMQVPYLARHGFRPIAYDCPGNGLAERTLDERAFEVDRTCEDAYVLLVNLYRERGQDAKVQETSVDQPPGESRVVVTEADKVGKRQHRSRAPPT